MKNNFLISIILVIVSALAVVNFGFPQYYNLRAKLDRLEILNKTLSDSELLQVAKEEKFEILNSIQTQKVALIEKSIPKYTSTSVVLVNIELESMLGIFGLPLDVKFSIGTEKEEEVGILKLVRLPVTFTFDSINYLVIKQFVNIINKWERGFIINKVSIQEPANNPGVNNNVRASIGIELLFVKDDFDEVEIDDNIDNSQYE